MEHFYQTLDGENWFDYGDIYMDAVANAKDGDLFVEVGSFRGRSTVGMAVEIINSGKKIKFDCIDDWSLADTRADFFKNIERVKDYVNVIEGCSWEKLALYEDRSIDFCFLDATHKYKPVMNEIEAVLPKMKKGGMLAGHDYTENMDEDNQVYAAVNYVLGRNNISVIRNVWIYEKP